MSSLDLRPNRKYPNLPSITNDPASHRDALRSVTEALNIGQRRTADVLSSFIRVSDLVDLGLIELSGGSFASAPSTYTPSPHTHPLSTEVTGEGALAYLNSLAHAATTGLGADDHTQYIRVDGTRAFTGAQTTQALLPSTDGTYDLGTAAARYNVVNAGLLRIARGAGTFTQTNNGNIVGVATLGVGATGVATVKATTSNVNVLSIAVGYARVTTDGIATVEATGPGSFAHGGVTSSDSATIKVSATGTAAFASGIAGSSGGTALAISQVLSSGFGSFAQGYVVGGDSNTAYIRATSSGAFAQGYCRGGSFEVKNGDIAATGHGSFAVGYASSASLVASGIGSFAQGAANGVSTTTTNIIASGSGSFAHGLASGYEILASADGAFAVGDTNYTASIIASAVNAAQFGPGTNAQADSMQIGSAGLRLKGTTGAPTTKQNGDHWMGGTGNAFVTVRSNAKDVQLNVGQAYTVNTYTTRRNLPNSATVTLAEVADVLATLINDLKTTGHLN